LGLLGHGAAQPGDDLVEGSFGLPHVGALVLVTLGVRHHQEAVLDVIVDHQAIAQHEGGLGEPEGVRRPFGKALERADEVVPHIARSAAGEAGQVGGEGVTVVRQETAQHLQNVPLGIDELLPVSLLFDHGAVAPGAHHRAGVHADHGVACQALAPLDALQQERRPEVAQLQVHGDRGVDVRG